MDGVVLLVPTLLLLMTLENRGFSSVKTSVFSSVVKSPSTTNGVITIREPMRSGKIVFYFSCSWFKESTVSEQGS